MARLFLLAATAPVALVGGAPAPRRRTIKIGLVTALSGQSARAGEAITRGLTIAIDEINAKGGILGGRSRARRRDDEAQPGEGRRPPRAS